MMNRRAKTTPKIKILQKLSTWILKDWLQVHLPVSLKLQIWKLPSIPSVGGDKSDILCSWAVLYSYLWNFADGKTENRITFYVANDSPSSPDVRFPRGHLPWTEETVFRRTECNFEPEVCLSQFLYLAMLMESDSENSALSSSIRVHPSSKNGPSLFHWKLLQVKKALKADLNVLFCFHIISFCAFI